MCQSALYDLLLDFVRTSPAGPVLTFAILGGDGRFARQDVPACVLRTFEGIGLKIHAISRQCLRIYLYHVSVS